MTEPDFDRTWLYRASIDGKMIAEERHASDIVACQWAVQVVWRELVTRPTESPMLVERQDLSGDWVPVERVSRMREA
jgi:hypothetical protein